MVKKNLSLQTKHAEGRTLNRRVELKLTEN